MENSTQDTIRLSKLAREFNVGIATIIEFFGIKGIPIENNPNTKLSKELLQLFEKEFTKEDKYHVENKLKARRRENINQIEIKTTQTMSQIKSPIQKIIFGSPGTGKSYAISGKENPNSYLKQLGIKNEDDLNCIKTVFHPEYTYGDFIGKLLPLTDNDDRITYKYYVGHFLKALSQAYKNIISAPLNPDNVLLVIDEINRGNSAAIFGTVFQLLDRNEDGWSSYEISLSDLEFYSVLNSLGIIALKETYKLEDELVNFLPDEIKKDLGLNKGKKFTITKGEENIILDLVKISTNKIKLPPNLHIIATMNTSDNSIYFMDSAFKRRWDWQFIDVTSDGEKLNQKNRKMEDGFLWTDFVDSINEFIKTKCKIRKVEDKQIGYYFIKGEFITNESIENKLMFFLWDSVFNNEKRPLEKLLGLNSTQLVTFGDFVKNSPKFISAIKTKSFNQINEE